MTTAQHAEHWESLREDLSLLPASSGRTGAPRWIIHDPAAGKFFKIGWLEFEFLKRWHLAHGDRILKQIERETLLKPTMQDLNDFYHFLKTSHLLIAKTKADTELFLQAKELAKGEPLMQKAMKNYIFFRVPLIYPDQWLNKVSPYFSWMFTRIFVFITLLTAILGMTLILRNASEFISAFSILQNPFGIIMGLLVIAFSKVAHEFGHALMCKRYNCHVPSMGIAFIVFWPLLWTDTTDSWRLKNHHQRLNISAAGMMAELSLAAYASILWVIAPEGAFKDAMHILAGVTWTITLLVNLNPFMRFDGYYLLSDFLDIPNLQERSFRLAKNWMRRTLWGIQTVHQETLPAKLQSRLVVYAILTWIYRFFLFLGIALLVYTYFFKALGVFLMLVELWWFIARPILHEIKFWVNNKASMNMNLKRKTTYGLIIGSLTLFLFVPWQEHISAPAILKSEIETPLFAPQSGRVDAVHVQSGDVLTPHQPLFLISNPDLAHNHRQAEQKLKSLEQEFKDKSADQRYAKQSQLLETQIIEQRADVHLKRSALENLNITANEAGIITDIPSHIKQNSWVSKKDYLGLVRSQEISIDAFVSASDISRLTEGHNVLFYPINASSPIKGRINTISVAPMKHIPYPQMGSIHGGDIATTHSADEHSQTPRDTLYIINITPDTIEGDISAISIIGTARIKAEPVNIAQIYLRKIISLVIRESGL